MTERLDKKYLKPQILIFERALKEWNYLCLFIVFPWFIYANWNDGPLLALIIGCSGPWMIGAVLYLVPRTLIPSYFAMRKVVMEEEDG